MAGIIPGICADTNLNTGIERCAKKEGKTISVFITDYMSKYTPEADEFNTLLPTLVTTNSVNRIYPVGSIQENTLNGGDIATSDIGFSGTLPVGLNSYNEVYRIDGSDCLYKELLKLNKQRMRIFRVDDENYVYGTIKTVNGEEFFTGFDVTIYVYRTRDNGTDPYGLYMTVYYSANYENELKNMHAIKIDEIPEGLVGVTLKTVEGGVQVVAACSNVDYTATFGEDWTTAMFQNNSGASPTTVTYNTGTGLLTIAPAGSYRVKDASVLAPAGIYGLSGVDNYVQVTA